MTEQMTAKVEFIAELAETLVMEGRSMPVPVLAERLNTEGLLTSNGNSYAGGRGTYRLLTAACQRLASQGRQADADNIAEAYTTPDGWHAWDK